MGFARCCFSWCALAVALHAGGLSLRFVGHAVCGFVSPFHLAMSFVAFAVFFCLHGAAFVSRVCYVVCVFLTSLVCLLPLSRVRIGL